MTGGIELYQNHHPHTFLDEPSVSFVAERPHRPAQSDIQIRSTFRNFAIKMAKLPCLDKKRTRFFVLCSTFRNFAHMKATNETKTAAQQQEEVFREKAKHYLTCYIDHCPLHDQCLRWLVGQYTSPTPVAFTSINPHHPKAGTEECEMFRSNQRVMMKIGFTKMFLDMPGRMERIIRRQLISWWGRKYYFEMRRGDRPITPTQQQDIVDACYRHGWTGPIVYDGEREDWQW